MSNPRWFTVALAVTAIVPVACGDSADDTEAERSARPAAQLTQFLMRKDDEPGFRRGARPGAMPASGGTIKGVKGFVEEMRLPPADARRLRSEGFISFAYEPIRGPRTAGITNVALYETAEGAKRSLAHELRTDVIRKFLPDGAKIRRFDIPGIPGARGFTVSEPHVGNVFWVQGRCMLVLGNQGPGPFAGPLSTGARAIYRRTCGQCP